MTLEKITILYLPGNRLLTDLVDDDFIPMALHLAIPEGPKFEPLLRDQMQW